MSKMILIIEDERSIQNVIKAFLEDAGYTVILAGDGLEGVEQFRLHKPDLVLLDLMLPKIDGFAVCEILRKESRVPIIMLTALDDDDSQLKGFDALADDYITKPFSMPVVMKRIEAVLRRAEQGSTAPSSVIRYKEITLDTDSLTVLVGALSVSLTAREFDILKLLLENQGRVVSREKLLDSIWGYGYIGDEKIVNTHIKNIRKKLGVDYIETIRGAGYKIEKGRVAVDPEKAAVVREVFRRALEGESLTSLAIDLNRRGFTGVLGGKIADHGILRIRALPEGGDGSVRTFPRR